MPGAQCTHSLACNVKVAHERSHHRSTGITRHSRTQWFYGFLRALPGDQALLSPSLRIKASSLPGRADCLRQLDASLGASEPHDFAVREHPSRPKASTG